MVAAFERQGEVELMSINCRTAKALMVFDIECEPWVRMQDRRRNRRALTSRGDQSGPEEWENVEITEVDEHLMCGGNSDIDAHSCR
jgi:hypothetical protein